MLRNSATPESVSPETAVLTSEFYRNLINHSPDLTCIVDSQGVVQFVNLEVKTFGYEPSDVVGKSISYFLHPADLPLVDEAIQQMLARPEVTTRAERRLRKADGNWCVMETAATRMMLSDSFVIVIHMRDITSRLATEFQLAESQRNLSHLVNVIPEVFWISDAEIKVMSYVSPGYERVWGRSCESLYKSPASFWNAVFPDDVAQFGVRLDEQKSGKPYEAEYRIVRPDGEIRDIWDQAYPVVDPDSGNVTEYLGIAQDVTERKRNERNLRIFRKLIDGASDIMAIIDSATLTILDMNEHGIGKLGYTREELTHLQLQDIDNSDEAAILWKLSKQPLVASTIQYESSFCRRDGSTYPVDIIIERVETDIQYLFLSARDITEKRRLERGMRDTIEALASTMEKRDPYTAGHQVRVAKIAAAIGANMGLSANTIRGLELAGIVHDIGKITVPAEILSKPGRLSVPEFDLIKQHPQTGYEILNNVDFPWPIAEIVQQHHERCDGSGYPLGLCRDKILIEARILAVADVIESISAHRPYRPALGIDVAIKEIQEGREIHYDADAVDAALALYSKGVLAQMIS
ncbi:PAS domain S-box protein [Zhongshania sp. BJYM1]|uniref:PAS domain S-box protein n=1 Tax=Zhongshania aquatica TaxID=2965069 RepID=UPI0022B46D8F|nr:PAS domain S-box protein [Marortus sp. BJYM1]